MPQPLRQIEQRAVVRGQHRPVQPPREPRRHVAELLAEAAELLVELGPGVGVRRRRLGGESGVEEVEVPGEGEVGGVEEALEEPDLVRFRPYPVELERRLPPVSAVVFAVAGGGGGEVFEFWGEIRVRVRFGDFAFDGKLGFEGKVRVRVWGGVHGYETRALVLCSSLFCDLG